MRRGDHAQGRQGLGQLDHRQGDAVRPGRLGGSLAGIALVHGGVGHAGSQIADGIAPGRAGTSPTAPASEAALYAPVKRFLEARGYEVKGEICGCDVVALRAGAPGSAAVAELKLGLTLDLVLQGVDRMAFADDVWLAVAATARGRVRDERAVRLCRLLGFGLLAVDAARGRVEVLAEPAPYRPRKSPRRRERVLREHQARHGDPMPGGSTRLPVMTAYRQRALACAATLRDGPCPVAALAAAVPNAGSILLRNVYGWFARERRGVYRLTGPGRQALAAWGGPVNGRVDADGQADPDAVVRPA